MRPNLEILMIFNLLGKTILENSSWCLETVTHKEKEVARNTEIEREKEIQIERIKQSLKSFKLTR